MDQAERRRFLIRFLLDERPGYRGMEIPREEAAQRQLLRGLLNTRMPKAALL